MRLGTVVKGWVGRLLPWVRVGLSGSFHGMLLSRLNPGGRESEAGVSVLRQDPCVGSND